MLLRDVLSGVKVISTNCDLNTDISSICHDSRNVSDGALFVAISGFQTDGNRFAKQALEGGAKAVLTETPNDDIPYIQVDNTRKSLAIVAANFQRHPAKEMKIIGVTGTNGKTTVTYLLKQILEDVGAKVGLIGTNQNMIGDEIIPTERTTPEPNGLQALLRQMADSGCTHVVMEVSSHSLVLHRVHGIEFEVGVFTNLTQDHLDFHKTMEAYAEAKAKLFGMCKYGVVNLDDAAVDVMLGGSCKYITYSTKQNKADVVCQNIKLREKGVSFETFYNGDIAHTELGIPGEFSVYNALSVIGAAMALGIELSRAVNVLRGAKGVCGRAEIVPVNADFTVMIDYAHSPDGLENILKTVRGFAKGRVIALFGCGGDRDATKRPIMGRIASELADFVIVTSDNPRTEEPMSIIEQILPGIKKKKCSYHVEVSRVRAIHYALSNAKPGDVIVLAGKGHETYQEICGVKHHLDEREVVAEFFAGV